MLGKLSAARSIAFRVLLRASQASDVGSIPIARSITHDDSIGLAHLNCRNLAEKWPFLDPKWTPVNWTLVFRRKNRPVGRTYKPDWPVFRAFYSQCFCWFLRPTGTRRAERYLMIGKVPIRSHPSHRLIVAQNVPIDTEGRRRVRMTQLSLLSIELAKVGI